MKNGGTFFTSKLIDSVFLFWEINGFRSRFNYKIVDLPDMCLGEVMKIIFLLD